MPFPGDRAVHEEAVHEEAGGEEERPQNSREAAPSLGACPQPVPAPSEAERSRAGVCFYTGHISPF